MKKSAMKKMLALRKERKAKHSHQQLAEKPKHHHHHAKKHHKALHAHKKQIAKK